MADDLTPLMSLEERHHAERLSLQDRRPPTVVPGYDLERPLGEGAYGEVWLALDRNTNCRVAVKFYSHRGGLDWSLLSREVDKLRFLRADRYVVQLLEVGWNANPPYYVMEFMERGSLEDQLEHGLPGVVEAVALARGVAVALVHAHARGILHCDLKPANILLDQDGKPRLADFGQARLTHEQNPALGTLFYMAPEQADLKAVPDARWDVYALGALLYRMLTGQAPYRSDTVVTEMQRGADLEERLGRYRRCIAKAPRPTAHYKVPGVDRRLAEIIDRCLALKPEKRFANAQAVLAALDNRTLHRARRPLLVLGAVGPALLLAVVGLFAVLGFNTAMSTSDKALTARSLDSNRYAARFVAASVARQMNQRWTILAEEAELPELPGLLRAVADKDPDTKDPDAKERQQLQDWLDCRRDQYQKTTSARAWFFLNPQGKLVAASPRKLSLKSLGKSFAYRSYFHGGPRDFTPEEMEEMKAQGRPPPPTGHPSISMVFESTSEGNPRMVVFSVPVTDRVGNPLGVLGMGVNVGDFLELQGGNGANPSAQVQNQRFAVLIETRKDWEGQEGLILQHPLLRQCCEEHNKPPKVRVPSSRVATLQQLGVLALANQPAPREDTEIEDYQDPIARVDSPGAGAYTGPWLAAAAPVIIEPRNDNEKRLNTGWVVLVQERSSDALAPLQSLRSSLLLQGAVTFAMLILIVVGLWLFVVVVLNDSTSSRLAAFLRRRAGLASGSAVSGLVVSPTSRSDPGGAPTAQR